MSLWSCSNLHVFLHAQVVFVWPQTGPICSYDFKQFSVQCLSSIGRDFSNLKTNILSCYSLCIKVLSKVLETVKKNKKNQDEVTEDNSCYQSGSDNQDSWSPSQRERVKFGWKPNNE